MAGETLNRKGDYIESFSLIPGVHGKFDVRIDGDLIAEHRHEPNAHIFPDIQDLIQAIEIRILKSKRN